MDKNLIGHREFTDGTRRPVYADERGEYVFADNGERVHGVWIVPADEPMIVVASLK